VRRQDQVASLEGKRIVFVFAGEILGGAERGAFDLALPLKRAGADVQIFALDDRPGRARTIAEREGIPWNSVRTHWTGSRAARVLSLLRVAAVLRRLRPDVLLAHTNFPNVACGLIWRLTGAKLSVWNQWDVLGTKRFSPGLFRRALRATPLVITEAFHARDWLVAEWGADPARVHVIRADVQLAPPRAGRADWRERLGISEDDFAACMLAHFHSGKDHPTLLRAWFRVVDALRGTGPKPVLLLAGRPAGTESDVKALAFDLRLREHVQFLTDVDDVSGLLSAVDLAVISSRSEGFPRAALEPMAAGLAVVGTDVPGINEALGECDPRFLAAPGDVAALADAILLLIKDETLRSRTARENADRIETRRTAPEGTEAYTRLIFEELGGRLRHSGAGTVADTAQFKATRRP